MGPLQAGRFDARAGMIRKLVDWLDLRIGIRKLAHGALDEPISGGARMMYVFGSVVLFLIIVQFITGILLAFYYSPSATDAWGSVAYIEDQVAFGWLVRGLHHHGASAIVIAAGLHLFQTALYGAYKKPREVNWIIGVLLLGLILAFALTGYLLPWDQTGYWATKVATGIAGETPLVGDQVREVAQGGNEYGNLTLTRFFALHVLVLPAITAILVVAHVALFRKHGVTPKWNRTPDDLRRTTTPFWPDQLFRDMVAMAIAFAALIAYVVWQGGARLDAPADPSSSFDARPEWYFRALFQMLKYFEGPAETIAALGVPAIVGALLLGLPFLDRAPDRDPRKRIVPLAILGALAAFAGALTIVSFREDASDPALAEREAAAEARALRARALARANGVPVAGGAAVFTTAKWYRARSLWETKCAGCHSGKKAGPIIGPGYNNRDWIRGFLVNPSDDKYYGRTKLAKSDVAMPPVEQTGAELDALVELIYAQTGAVDVDTAKVAAGTALFEDACGGCHTLEPGAISESAPTLVGRGSRDYLIDLIDSPAGPRFFAVGNQMPTFDDLDRADRGALADWLIYLRTATQADIDALGPID
jgi:ubiquinol-cytochrome c reductase cytochrome b subunit